MDYLLIINIILTNSGVLKLIKLQIASVVCRRSTMLRRQFTLDEKIGRIGRLENGEKNSVIFKNSAPVRRQFRPNGRTGIRD